MAFTWTDHSTSRALATANSNVTSQITIPSSTKVKVKVGYMCDIVWNSVITPVRIEKIATPEEGEPMIYFSIAPRKAFGSREVQAYGAKAFKTMMVHGPEKEVEI